MAETIRRPKPKLTENKLLMLYAIRDLGGVTNSQALRFFIENDLMDYIDVQLSLAELTEGGLLSVASEPLGKTYALSKLGADAVNFFSKNVPRSRRVAVDALIPHWREEFRRESQLFADYTQSYQGDYVARLAAREEGKLLFEVNISVPTAQQAALLCQNWHQRSSQVYQHIMEMLMAELKEKM